MSQYCVINLLSPLPTGEPYCSVQFYIVLVTWDFHKYTLKVRHHLLLHFSHLFSYSLKLLTVEKTVKVIGALGGDFGVILLFSCLVIAQARKHIAMRIGANRCHDNECWVSCGSEVSDQTIDSKCWEVCNSVKRVKVINLQRVIPKNLQLLSTFQRTLWRVAGHLFTLTCCVVFSAKYQTTCFSRNRRWRRPKQSKKREKILDSHSSGGSEISRLQIKVVQ